MPNTAPKNNRVNIHNGTGANPNTTAHTAKRLRRTPNRVASPAAIKPKMIANKPGTPTKINNVRVQLGTTSPATEATHPNTKPATANGRAGGTNT